MQAAGFGAHRGHARLIERLLHMLLVRLHRQSLRVCQWLHAENRAFNTMYIIYDTESFHIILELVVLNQFSKNVQKIIHLSVPQHSSQDGQN